MVNTGVDKGKVHRARTFRIHFLGFAGISILLFMLDLVTLGPLWFYWPVMAWGAVIGAHWLYCKSLAVDDDWADRRVSEVLYKSYDLGHIRQIEESYKNKQSSDSGERTE